MTVMPSWAKAKNTRWAAVEYEIGAPSFKKAAGSRPSLVRHFSSDWNSVSSRSANRNFGYIVDMGFVHKMEEARIEQAGQMAQGGIRGGLVADEDMVVLPG